VLDAIPINRIPVSYRFSRYAPGLQDQRQPLDYGNCTLRLPAALPVPFSTARPEIWPLLTCGVRCLATYRRKKSVSPGIPPYFR